MKNEEPDMQWSRFSEDGQHNVNQENGTSTESVPAQNVKVPGPSATMCILMEDTPQSAPDKYRKMQKVLSLMKARVWNV